MHVSWFKKGDHVLDAGCGEGVLSLLMAQKGAHVTGMDISKPNVEAANQLKEKNQEKIQGSLEFLQADSENIPFADESFDYVVSNHVLEHVPDFDKGLSEVERVTKKKAFIAIPTCLNPCSISLLGMDNYWMIGKRTPFSIVLGILRVLFAFLTFQIGVDETYGGDKNNHHIFRFPWILKNKLKKTSLKLQSVEAQSIHLAYVDLNFNSLRKSPLFRYFGIGTLYISTKS